MGILNHTIGIFTHPDTEWKLIRAERSSFKQVFISHVPLLSLIPVLAAYFGVTRVGWSVGGGETIMLTSESALVLCAITYFALLMGVFILGEFINWMSKTFGVKDGEDQRHYDGTALAVYVTTPLFLASVVLAYPQIWVVASILMLAGAYTVYLIYEGIPILMNIEKEQGFMYASSVITVALVMLVTAIIGTVIIWGVGIGPVYTN